MLSQAMCRTLAVIVTVAGFAVSGYAVAPSEEAIAKFKADGTWEKVMANLAAFRAAGGCQPALDNYLTSPKHLLKMATSAQVVDTLLVPVILVDFPDFHYNDTTYTYTTPTVGILQAKAIGKPQAFDSILFSRKDQGGNPTGSMTDYYLENSYGKLVIIGQVYGWYTVSNNYSYYVGSNSGLGAGGATLARDAVVAAKNALVEFTPYDNDNNDTVDAVIVIHAGPGAETGVYGIWSHRSSMIPVSLPGGKYAFAYTMNPEEMGSSVHPIGVFCHEYGHILGLPDLYDRDPSHTQSEGLGAWSLMASGNYNGNSKSPAHLDPWCKRRLGFISPTEHVLTRPTNLYQTPIPQVESEPFAYCLTPYLGSKEYFLIENRQLYGFDTGLPGEGLLIYHIDENQTDNDNPAHYMVALEQADGMNGLAFSGSRGDGGDPFPGYTGNRNFHDLSVPNSWTYLSTETQIAAWRISNSDSIMYADLDTRWSRPWVVLSGPDSIRFTDPVPNGDGDGVLEAGETISFSFGVRNLMKSAFTPSATLSCNDPNLTFMNNPVALSDSLSPMSAIPVGPVAPIKFRIPDDWQTHFVKFTLNLVMDSSLTGGVTWDTSFTFSRAIGRTQIVLVDDDNGRPYETRLGTALTNLGIPYDVWEIKTKGTPLPGNLASYKSLFWFTGNETLPVVGGAIDTTKIATLKAFMDGGGNVCLASVRAPSQISAIDTGFMSRYLHAQNGGLTPVDQIAVYDGVVGNDVSNGIAVGITAAPVTYVNTILIPVNGGQPAFTFKDEFGLNSYGNGGVTYAGSYRSVFLSFALEFLSPSPFPVLRQPVDTLMSRIVSFFAKGAATAIEDGDQATLPSGFAVEQNYPNPFNPSTVIEYTIPASAGQTRMERTTLTIYNLMGQTVATVIDRMDAPGRYSVTWDARTSGGAKAASGAYFYRLSHGEQSVTKKMILLK